MTRAARARRPGEAIFAAVLTAVGIGIIVGSPHIPEPASAGSMGPRAFPILAGALLTCGAAATLVSVLRGHGAADEASEDMDQTRRTDWRTLGILAAIFIAHVALISVAGWPIAAWLLFAGVGLTLGARPWWRPVLAGAILALLLQVAFAGGLGLSLPPGPLLEGVSFLHG